MQNRLSIKQAKRLSKLPIEFKPELYYIEFSGLHRGMERTGCILCHEVNLKDLKANPNDCGSCFLIFGKIPEILSEAIDYLCDGTYTHTGNVYPAYNVSELMGIILKYNGINEFSKLIKEKMKDNASFDIAYDPQTIVDFLINLEI